MKPETCPDTTRLKILNALCLEYQLLNRYDQSVYWGRQSISIAENFLARSTGKEQNPIRKALADACYYLGGTYDTKGENKQAMGFYSKGLKQFEKLSDKKGIANSYNNIGMILHARGEYDHALTFLFKSMKIREEIADKKGLSFSYNSIGMVQANKGNFEIAIEFFFKDLKLSEELGDVRGTAHAYNNIGLIHKNKGDYEKAVEFFLKSLEIKEALGDKKGIAFSFNNIGIIHAKQGNYEQALKFFFKSLKIREEIRDMKGSGDSYGNIGIMYKTKGDIFRSQGKGAQAALDYANAMEYYFKAVKIFEDLGDKLALAYSYNNIANFYLVQNNLPLAKEKAMKSLEIAREVSAKPVIMSAYQLLSHCDSASGNFKDAYRFSKLYSEIKDTLFNEKSNKIIGEMQTKYESDKKEKEIKLLKKDQVLQQSEAKKQKIIRNSFIGASLLALLLALVLFSRYQIKRKANKQLTEQNEKIRSQKATIEEQKQNLTDSIEYASYIQKAVLPSDTEFKSVFPDSFILFRPRDIVSGDFYYLTPCPSPPFDSAQGTGEGGGTLLALGDCTGHGVPGAFMSMLCNALLNETVNDKGLTQPDEILQEVRMGIISALKQREGGGGSKDGMDCSLILLTPRPPLLEERGGRLSSLKGENSGGGEFPSPKGEGLGVRCMATCANNPVYIVSGSVLTEIKADRQPVGFSYNPTPFTIHEIELQHGDMIYLTSDGFEDQLGGSPAPKSPKGDLSALSPPFGSRGAEKKFKNKRLKELLISISDKSTHEQKIILEKTFDEWRGNLEQTDDVTVIGIRV